MQIQLNKVIPIPLHDYNHDASNIWNNELTINTPGNILIDAASGKGKSTFTHILCGLRNDFSGEVLINQKNINTFNLNDWVELRKTKMSIVFQDLQLFGKLTAWENLLLKNNLTNYKTTDEIENYLSILGLADRKNQLAATLSYGQQQRIAIIRALLQPFEIMILDEPFSHLDIDNSTIALNMILKEVKKQNAGMIITSLGSNHGITYDNILKL